MLRGRRALIALAGATLVLAFGVPGAASTPTTPYDLVSVDGLSARVLRGLNTLRKDYGLGPLRLNPALTAAAASHANEMLQGGYFAHESADGTPYWERLEKFYRPGQDRARWSVGENLFWAAPEISAVQALRQWMQSPHHRINLLVPDWQDVGIAAVRAKGVPGVFNGLSVTVLTVDFGVR